MTVYVPQYNRETEQRKDLSDLTRYGAVRTIAWRYPYPDDEDPGREPMELLSAALESFDPNKDWLALVGSYVHIAAALFILGKRGTEKVRLLVYDRKFDGYYPVALNTGDIRVRHPSNIESNQACGAA